MLLRLWYVVVGLSLCGCGTSVRATEFRTLDGGGNNQTNARLGQVGQRLMRYSVPQYTDGIGAVDAAAPNPRVISNLLFTQAAPQPDPRGLSNMVWAWGQFVDHDITHSLVDATNGTLQIPIPAGDPVFGDMAGQSIHVTRSGFAAGTGVTTLRQQVNNITSWIDASMVYGGRAIDAPASVSRPDYLRTGSGGKLKVSDGGAMGDMLPKYFDGVSPEMDNTHRPTMSGTAYVAGDVRANENPALLSLQTLFVREHNRLADVVTQCAAALSDEEIYQRARKIVGAEIQTITFNEYLPALGVGVGSYAGYDPTVDPAISNEFANAAFRMGHSQVGKMIPRLSENGTPIPEGHLELVGSFFSPDTMLEGGLEPILRGLSGTVQESTDAKLIDDLRNQLFQVFLPEVGLLDNATDLAAMNIMRGRDHGLGTYNQTRDALGLAKAASWTDMSSDISVQESLALLYDSVEDVDLYAGLLSEDHLAGSSLGETITTILADQFARLRDADRFWYENDLQDVNADLLCATAWDSATVQPAHEWLSSLQLSDVIQLNTRIGTIQENVFFAVPEPSGLGLLVMGLILARRRPRGVSRERNSVGSSTL